MKVEEIAKTYTHLTSMTKEPVLVDSFLAMLCRGANQRDIEKAAKINGTRSRLPLVILDPFQLSQGS